MICFRFVLVCSMLSAIIVFKQNSLLSEKGLSYTYNNLFVPFNIIHLDTQQ